jgi:hypothetical protein
MNPQNLLDKLIQIERAIGVETNFTVKKMLIEAEEFLLELEKERVQALHRDAYRSVLSGFRSEPSSFALRPEPPTSILATVKSRVLVRGRIWLNNALHPAYQVRFSSKRPRKLTQPIS